VFIRDGAVTRVKSDNVQARDLLVEESFEMPAHLSSRTSRMQKVSLLSSLDCHYL
jgi:hypothetical protein